MSEDSKAKETKTEEETTKPEETKPEVVKKPKSEMNIIEVISDFEESLRNLHRINSK